MRSPRRWRTRTACTSPRGAGPRPRADPRLGHARWHLRPLTAALAPHFRLHLVDLPGHGASAEREGPRSRRRRARLAATVPRCGWLVLGLVALQAALDAPTQVRGWPWSPQPALRRRRGLAHGVAHRVFTEFADGLRHDYHRTIERFLALEAVGPSTCRRLCASSRPRVRARRAGRACCAMASPSSTAATCAPICRSWPCQPVDRRSARSADSACGRHGLGRGGRAGAATSNCPPGMRPSSATPPRWPRPRSIHAELPATPPFDTRQVRRAFSRAAARYREHAPSCSARGPPARAPRLRHHAAAACWTGAGPSRASLGPAQALAQAEVIALDLALPMLRGRARGRLVPPPARGVRRRAPPLADASVDCSPACASSGSTDLPALFDEFRRVLRPGGFLALATFGSDTLHDCAPPEPRWFGVRTSGSSSTSCTSATL